MNKVKIFNSEEFGAVRTVTINGEPWFVGKDVALALGYSYPQKAVRDHVLEEDRGVNEMDTPSGRQKLVTINESGLYALIFGSKLDSAQRFKHWVTSEVLPAIRKTGSYQAPQGKELLALAVLEAQKTIEEQSKAIERMKPKVIFANAVETSHTSILTGIPKSTLNDLCKGSIPRLDTLEQIAKGLQVRMHDLYDSPYK